MYQSSYFHTPRIALTFAGFLVMISFVFSVGFAVYYEGNSATQPESVLSLYVLVFVLHLVVLVVMTYFFMRPLVFSGEDFPASSVVVDVVRRTAIGAAVHVATSVIYLGLFVSTYIVSRTFKLIFDSYMI